MFDARGDVGGLGVCCGDLDLDLDLILGDGGVEVSRGSKRLRLAREFLSSFGDGGWRLEDVEGCKEDRLGCLWTVFFLLTCSHLFPDLHSFHFHFCFCTSISKMTIFVTYLAFEGNLFIIQLLYVCSLVHFDFDGF